ncbi:MAG: chloride channel protein, partial [Myxococcota bacterium]
MGEPRPRAGRRRAVTTGRGVRQAATTGALPVAPSMGPALASENIARRAEPMLIGRRTLWLSALAVGLAILTGFAAALLSELIDFITGLAFHGRAALGPSSPADHELGPWVVVVPVIGGLVVGVMARFGTSAIRGHGIPEAMERVLEHESRIPVKMTFLKPVSAAVAIGTGGPFGAEGPIIATGGAMGSTLGQLLGTSAKERKTLLAAGAAAGMAATFGSPVSAVLLAIELLLFELAPRSLIPVTLAAATGAIVGAIHRGTGAVFPMPAIEAPGVAAFALYLALGAVIGLASVLVTQGVYAVERAFERLPIHWMWWPALGGLAVGLVGLVEPRAMGVGYDNIRGVVAGTFAAAPLAALVALKGVAWMLALGSGTSGGTLAPLFTLGGGLGALAGMGLAAAFPEAGVDPRIGALVGMAAMFAGASRALLASVVFAFETTRQPMGLVPLLGGCGAAYLVSLALMRHSIMTRRIAERGIAVPGEVSSDPLQRVKVGALMTRHVETLRADDLVGPVRRWLATAAPAAAHGGWPVIDSIGRLVGLVTRKDLAQSSVTDVARVGSIARRPVMVGHSDEPVRVALDRMVANDIGRLPVVASEDAAKLVGILTRSDVLRAFRGPASDDVIAEGKLAGRWRLRPRRRPSV